MCTYSVRTAYGAYFSISRAKIRTYIDSTIIVINSCHCDKNYGITRAGRYAGKYWFYKIHSYSLQFLLVSPSQSMVVRICKFVGKTLSVDGIKSLFFVLYHYPSLE